jgi:hypothetical protein
MAQDAYSGYSYKRYRGRPKVFLFIALPVILAILFFVANLAFGFIDFKHTRAPASVKISSVTFYARLTTPQKTKSEAMRTATETKNTGGSGYMLNTGEPGWAVVMDIGPNAFDGSTATTTKDAQIHLSSLDHKALIESLTGTFKVSFETVCGFLKDPSVASASARLAYNNLVDLTGELEKIQATAQNPAYTRLLTYLTRQLFGLNLLWLDAGGDNFAHVIKNAASWIIYALFDLTAGL